MLIGEPTCKGVDQGQLNDDVVSSSTLYYRILTWTILQRYLEYITIHVLGPRYLLVIHASIAFGVPASARMETIKSALGGGGNGADGDAPGDVQLPGGKDGGDGDMPSREEMLKTIESLQKAQKAQTTANNLKSKAMAMTNSTQREKMLKEAFDKEMEAHGHSKMAKRLQSGTWQGLGFGGGIGAASGLGLGAGVGTVLGAILAVPSTGLGMLVGSGVGAIHGPWVKLGGGKEEPFEDADPEKVVDALEEERRQQRQQQQQGGAGGGQGQPQSQPQSTETGEKARRKPPKLEVRSKKNAETETGAGRGRQQPDAASDKGAVNVKEGVSEESKPRRKPPKLEIRSGKAGSTAKA